MKAKPGVLTTEFWLALVVGIATLISAIQSWLPPQYAAIASAVVAGLYAISRGITKSNTAAPSVAPTLPQLVVKQPAPPPPPA